MSYATVATAAASATLTERIELALRGKAYARIDNVANTADQREYRACNTMFAGSAPASWVDMVLLRLDVNGTLATATDAEIDTAVTTVWTRIALVN